MCGFAGFWQPPGEAAEDLRRRALAMADTMVSRGPDAGDAKVVPESGFAVAHRRLAIIDLSPEGGQPMVSSDGRWILAYNGEVYNFRELRAELAARGVDFSGDSDTEVVLAACRHWGVGGAIERFVGMFAFALHDREEGIVHLVRDRIGIKPCYFGFQNGRLYFASQVKAILADERFDPAIDPAALASYFRFAYVPSPLSIYRDLQQVPPGHRITLGREGVRSNTAWWDARKVARRPRSRVGFATHVERTEAAIREAVGQRLVADVPLGAFLSGGIDSSVVVALARECAGRPIETFSIGFGDPRYDEASYAADIARRLDTVHHELRATPDQALDLVRELPAHYDEPFADSSQLPTLLVSRMTRERVTVALSGDGGDEGFVGYNRYHLAGRIDRLFRPGSLGRPALAALIRVMHPAAVDALVGFLPKRHRPFSASDKLLKLEELLRQPDADRAFPFLVSTFARPSEAIAVPPADAFDRELASTGDLLPIDRMRLLDQLAYLPGDILTKVDRASMAYGLEARVPLLDHRVLELAWSIPLKHHLRGKRTKALLREVLYRRLPRDLVDRPKMGFAIPLADWLRGPLRGWAEEHLNGSALGRHADLRADCIRRLWREHLSGRRNWAAKLWAVLMFQEWAGHRCRSQSQAA